MDKILRTLIVCLVMGMIVFLAAGWYQTTTRFIPRARQIEMDLRDMSDRLDGMIEEVEAMGDGD